MQREEILKVREKRHHSIKNSYGVKDAFTYYRSHRPNEHKYVLTDLQYMHIIRTVNNLIKESLLSGNDIVFPEKMGSLEFRKKRTLTRFEDGKLITSLPIDWDRTLKLWCEDDEAYKNKQLVRIETDEVFRVFYNKVSANFKNKAFYSFKTNRELKLALRDKIKSGNFDAFLLNQS